MRDLIFFVVIAGSWILAPIALFVLVRRREYRRALGFGGFMAAVPVLWSWVLSLRDPHLRKWLGYPAGLLLVFWLFSGIWLFNAAWGSVSAETESNPHEHWLTRRRRVAGAVAVSGVALWCIGFWQVPPNGWLELGFIIVSSTAVLLGVINLAAE